MPDVSTSKCISTEYAAGLIQAVGDGTSGQQQLYRIVLTGVLDPEKLDVREQSLIEVRSAVSIAFSFILLTHQTTPSTFV